jgi:glutamate dehydrogenase (NAD(P)+)
MQKELLAHPVFAMAAEQFDSVADFLQLPDDLRERCKWPKRLISVAVPVKLDDGTTKVFYGHRVQHHLTRGQSKAACVITPQWTSAR